MPKDQDYILDLCDRVLDRSSLRQHRFDFLRGDTGRRLPVDAYYADLKLVVEYRERQHVETIPFWDRKPTASGISRGQQRAMYDQRRRDVLAQHEITLVELSFSDFQHDGRKRLRRVPAKDEAVIRARLENWIMKRRTVRSEAEIGPLMQQIVQSGSFAIKSLLAVCANPTPLDALRRIKFEPIGFDPLNSTPLNLIEQVNQTFTYLATLQALRYLFRHHPQSAPFTVNLGTESGPDIASCDGAVVAEVFSAVTPSNNRKLMKDARKVYSTNAAHRYVFFACPKEAPGEIPGLKDFPGVKIVSLGLPSVNQTQPTPRLSAEPGS